MLTETKLHEIEARADSFECQECGLTGEIRSLVADVKRLRVELAKSFAFATEAKKTFAPKTTNSLVDEWLAQVHQALGGEP